MRENDEKSTSIDIIALSDHAHVQYVYHKTKFQVQSICTGTSLCYYVSTSQRPAQRAVLLSPHLTLLERLFFPFHSEQEMPKPRHLPRTPQQEDEETCHSSDLRTSSRPSKMCTVPNTFVRSAARESAGALSIAPRKARASSRTSPRTDGRRADSSASCHPPRALPLSIDHRLFTRACLR